MGVGVQPYGYDDIMKPSLYFWYKVIASKIAVRVYKTSNTDQVTISLLPGFTSFTYDGIDDLKAYGRCTQKRLSDDKPTLYFKRYMTTAEMFRGRINIGDADLSAQYNTNPSTQYHWHLFADSTVVAQTVQIYFDVEITYYCRLLRQDSMNES